MNSKVTTESVATRFGPLDVLPNDRPIAEALRLYGEWAQGEIEVLTELLPTNGVIVDGGSHIGVLARAFALASPRSIVHAFEPHPQLATVLKKNVADLADRIVVHERALGISVGTGYLNSIDDVRPGNMGAQAVAFSSSEDTVEVVVSPLDALHLENVGFIKLDVEGAELSALAGAMQTIRRDRPVIACEINTLDAGVDLFFHMRSLAYSVYLLTARAFNPANHAREVKNIFGFASETSLIFLPPGRLPPASTEIATMQSVGSVHDLAQAFLAAPRFGDEAAYSRNPTVLRERLRSANARMEALTNTVREEPNIDEARIHAADLRKQVASLRADLRSQQEETARTRADASASREHRFAAERRHDAARASLDDLENRFTESIKQLAELERDLSRERSKGAAVSRQLAEETEHREAEVRTLQQQAEMASAKASKIEAVLSEMRLRDQDAQQSLELLRQTIRTARTENQRLQIELQASATTRDDMQSKLDAELTRRSVLLSYLQPNSVSKTRRGVMGRLSRYVGGSLALAHQEVRQSGLFDETWYLKTYPDVGASAFDPIVHYLLVGGFEGLNPSPAFDTSAYLTTYPDVATSGLNPLIHYLRWGRKELRKPRGALNPVPRKHTETVSEDQFRQKAPPIEAFERFAVLAKGRDRTPVVDIVIPVFKGYDETIACIGSVLASQNNTPHEIVVIDDFSPQAELSQALRELASRRLITLIRNDQNLGFVRTANRGMSLNPERDVVLLNSDTLVFNNWLDRLRTHAQGARIASVTPFTNNGTICSYPLFCADNPLAAGTRLEAIDELARELAMGEMELPTGVGFCMYLTRASLNDVGMFDEFTFGRGYGEENDLCMRAAKREWKNVQALDTFVFHSGETSFGDSAKESKLRGLAAVQRKHPDYEATVKSYIATDPARGARIALDTARSLGRKPKDTIVCVTHTFGGGIERHLNDRTLAAAAQGQDILMVSPAVPGTARLRMATDGNQTIPNAADLDLASRLAAFATALKALNVRTIELHSTVGWSHRFVDLIPALVDAVGADLKIVLHDYTFACPQTTMINESGRYCGELGEAQCTRCLSRMTVQPCVIHPDLTPNALPTIRQWRQAYGNLLAKAQSVVTPSQDSISRLKRYFPEILFDVEPHKENLSHIPRSRRARAKGEDLRVAILGAIGPHKGSRILLDCARDATRRALPIRFFVVGYTDIDAALQEAGVTITGKYLERDVGSRLRDVSPDVAFLPSVWPETFCFTLSIALAAGLPIVTFDLGAQAERLRGNYNAMLLPISAMQNATEINDRIIQFGEATQMPSALAK